jgi:parallel beta-helix repeat protein
VEPAVQFTTIVNNLVMGSGLDGISLFRTASDNTVQHNRVEENGFHTAAHRKGDGIRVFSDRNLVQDNSSFGNAADGIGVGFRTPRGVIVPAVQNRILDNDTGGNVLFDLHDFNLNCDSNVWSGNTFQTADPPCTTGP